MATITRVPVTLTPDQADFVCLILGESASKEFAFSRRTKSASLREYSTNKARKALDLAGTITRSSYETKG